MNISGPSVAATYHKTVSSPKSLIVMADSLLHPVETLSVKLGGSANGHNGVKSVITALGGETDFYRFRIGIGRNDTDAAVYVLQKLSNHERQFWSNEGLDLVLSELETIARKSTS
jgi:PTH1 family peptidyl-tRNA hydrolase